MLVTKKSPLVFSRNRAGAPEAFQYWGGVLSFFLKLHFQWESRLLYTFCTKVRLKLLSRNSKIEC